MSAADPGRINRNNLKVVRNTKLRGTDHNPCVCELECLDCGDGANGSGIHQRRRPHCDPMSRGEDLLA